MTTLLHIASFVWIMICLTAGILVIAFVIMLIPVWLAHRDANYCAERDAEADSKGVEL